MIPLMLEISLKDKTEERTADVVEKTGGKKAVGHLRKHWKKYAALAGTGLVTSLAGEGMRLAAGKKIRDIAKAQEPNQYNLQKASKMLKRGEMIDTAGTATTVGAGLAAGTGEYIRSKRKGKK